MLKTVKELCLVCGGDRWLSDPLDPSRSVACGYCDSLGWVEVSPASLPSPEKATAETLTTFTDRANQLIKEGASRHRQFHICIVDTSRGVRAHPELPLTHKLDAPIVEVLTLLLGQLQLEKARTRPPNRCTDKPGVLDKKAMDMRVGDVIAHLKDRRPVPAVHTYASATRGASGSVSTSTSTIGKRSAATRR